jgi:hypothetical protein
VAVPRSGNAEGVGVGNRFAQEFDQRIVDARVFDASGGEEKFHDSTGHYRAANSELLTVERESNSSISKKLIEIGI